MVTNRNLIEAQKDTEEAVDDKPKEEVSKLPPGIEAKWVTAFLLIQFFANLLTNIDTGIIPAAPS